MKDGVLASDETILIRNKLLEHHEGMLNLCTKLEQIADFLPNIHDIQECLVICRDLFPIIKNAHNFEESILFPLLHDAQQDAVALDKNLERLRYEHWEDESFAEEISDVFRAYIDEPSKTEAEKLAYMLRGFFEGIRRHIAFETEYLVPLIGRSA